MFLVLHPINVSGVPDSHFHDTHAIPRVPAMADFVRIDPRVIQQPGMNVLCHFARALDPATQKISKCCKVTIVAESSRRPRVIVRNNSTHNADDR